MRICSMVANQRRTHAAAFLRFFPDTPFPILPSKRICMPFLLPQSELIEGQKKPPHLPKGKNKGLNMQNFNFLLSFLDLLGFWLCVCLQHLVMLNQPLTSHGRSSKRLPVSAPVHCQKAAKGRAAFSLSTMTTLTADTAMSTASSMIKSRDSPRCPSSNREIAVYSLYLVREVHAHRSLSR